MPFVRFQQPRVPPFLSQMQEPMAESYAQFIFSQHVQTASLSTGTNVYVNVDGKQEPVAGAWSSWVTASSQLENLLRLHPALKPGDFIRLDNPMRDNLGTAREILLTRGKGKLAPWEPSQAPHRRRTLCLHEKPDDQRRRLRSAR